MRLDSDLATLAAELRIGAAVEAAEASVVEWRRAVGSPLPHRLEPFLHERLWLCRGAFGEGHERYGFDAAGEVVIVHGVDEGEVVLRAPGIVVTALFAGGLLNGLIRHWLSDGRPVRSEYHGTTMDPADRGEERYVYDGDALVAIEEYHALMWTARTSGWRCQVSNLGGRVEVGDGVLTLDDQVIWRSGDEPFAQRLARSVPGFVDACVDGLFGGFDRLRPVDTLWLDNYTQGGIHVVPTVGYADRPDRWDIFEGPPYEILFDDHENTLLREAALAVEDPVRTVTEAVGRALAVHDWRRVLKTTPDFVVGVGEYGDDPEAKVAVLRRLNRATLTSAAGEA